MSCYHLYKMYLGLDFYIHRRWHSVSTTKNANKRQNAKALNFQEQGHYGLRRAQKERRARKKKTALNQPLAIVFLPSLWRFLRCMT